MTEIIPLTNKLTITDITKSLEKHPYKRYKERTSRRQMKRIVIHHYGPGGDIASINSVNYYHIRKGWPGYAYNLCIKANGDIYKTQKFTTIGYHVGPYNVTSLGIVLEGNLDLHPPTEKQIEALLLLIHDYLFPIYPQLKYTDVVGHGELLLYRWKSCPGKCTSMKQIRERLRDFDKTADEKN